MIGPHVIHVRHIAGNPSDLLPWGENSTVSRRSSDLDPAFDPVAERLVDVGRHLRETRQQRGEDLYDVADYLRIKPSYLFALEEGDLKAMPGRTYAMGFLRTYADHLGFDGGEVVRNLNGTARATSSVALEVRQPAPENRLPSLPVVIGALVLAGVAYGGWFAAQSGDEVLARIKAVPGEIGQYAATLFDEEAIAGAADEARPQAPEMLVAGTGTTNSSPVRTPVVGSTAATDAGRTPDPAAPGLQAREVPANAPTAGPAPADRATSDAGSPNDLTGAVAATAAIDRQGPTDAATGSRTGGDGIAGLALDAEAERDAALRRVTDHRPDGGTAGELLAGLQPGAQTAGGLNGPAEATATTAPVTSSTGRVVLLAREASWIQVQSPARDFLRSTTLEPGDRFEIPDRNDLALWTGNAGGLEIWIDGQNVGVLGRSGAVMRDVSLAPEALIARR